MKLRIQIGNNEISIAKNRSKSAVKICFQNDFSIYRGRIASISFVAVCVKHPVVEARMIMIEQIDKHPLSWPVATKYQRLKRMKAGNTEDDKLLSLAKKKVREDKFIQND